MSRASRHHLRRLAPVLLIAALGLATAVWLLRPSPRHDTRDPMQEPPILLSLDRTWWHRLGVSRFTYARAVARAGGRPIVVDFDDAGQREVDAARVAELLAPVRGLVLSGGGDADPALYGDSTPGRDVRPLRDSFELALLEEALRRRLPVLGICRGAQLLNIARGGTLRNFRDQPDLARRHHRWRGHEVLLTPGSRLAEIFGRERLRRVTSLHGLAVARPGEGLEIVARARDGMPEAIAGTTPGAPWMVGVQWHPELSVFSAPQRRLFRALVEAARVRGGREDRSPNPAAPSAGDGRGAG